MLRTVELTLTTEYKYAHCQSQYNMTTGHAHCQSQINMYDGTRPLPITQLTWSTGHTHCQSQFFMLSDGTYAH